LQNYGNCWNRQGFGAGVKITLTEVGLSILYHAEIRSVSEIVRGGFLFVLGRTHAYVTTNESKFSPRKWDKISTSQTQVRVPNS
jgi:hypothetical protein